MNLYRRRVKPLMRMACLGLGPFIGAKANKAILQRMKIRSC